jgi:hypothetical protein
MVKIDKYINRNNSPVFMERGINRVIASKIDDKKILSFYRGCFIDSFKAPNVVADESKDAYISKLDERVCAYNVGLKVHEIVTNLEGVCEDAHNATFFDMNSFSRREKSSINNRVRELEKKAKVQSEFYQEVLEENPQFNVFLNTKEVYLLPGHNSSKLIPLTDGVRELYDAVKYYVAEFEQKHGLSHARRD